jgi:hypothetical protein
MASTVTYKGPTDPLNGSVAYEIDNITFRINVPVEDVPEKVAKQVAADKQHQFTVTKQTES